MILKGMLLICGMILMKELSVVVDLVGEDCKDQVDEAMGGTMAEDCGASGGRVVGGGWWRDYEALGLWFEGEFQGPKGKGD